MLVDLSNTDKKTTIDDKHHARVMEFKWFLKRVRPSSYYVATSVRQNSRVKTLYLHRFILQARDDMDVHHINRNSLDNREENLEERVPILHRSWHLSKACSSKG